jgi:hypothetical protein
MAVINGFVYCAKIIIKSELGNDSTSKDRLRWQGEGVSLKPSQAFPKEE